jgi:hypothetical protein
MAEKLCRLRHLVAEQFAVFFGGVLYSYEKEKGRKEKEEIVFLSTHTPQRSKKSFKEYPFVGVKPDEVRLRGGCRVLRGA